MRTLGVDLASADDRTGAVVVDWSDTGGVVGAVAQPASDDLIEELASTSSSIAIDAPLGWPIAFTDALVANRETRPWPDAPTRALRYRRTDLRLAEERIWPLSVSTDRIGIVAFRAQRLLPRLGRGEHPARDGSDGIYEVYPAAALRRWSQQSRAYKRVDPAHAQSREVILGWLVGGFRLSVGEHRERLVASSDLLDALICAILAREAAEGRTEPVLDIDCEAAREEGWIHLPTRGRKEIATAR
jgi:predicted RNase H-like nuclease